MKDDWSMNSTIKPVFAAHTKVDTKKELALLN
jgi:hypothetical protein